MQKNILCIDDIESNLFILSSLFENPQKGYYDSYEIFTASSAHEGLEVLRHNRIDLILLDVMMPEVDGLTMAKMIKANKKLKHIPIVFVTAKTDDEVIQRCYEVGGSDYVSKPFNSIELLIRVDFHLKFQEKEQLLQRQMEYAQNIVDLQDNLIIVTDGDLATNVNHATLEFFGVTSLFEYQKKFRCVCKMFQELEGVFHLGGMKEDGSWIEELIERLKHEDVVVAMEDHQKRLREFTIRAKQFYEYYILSLTDITTIYKQKIKYEHDANFDPLTQVYNRSAFHRLLHKKIHEASSTSTSLSLVLLDIDHFKSVNDTYGHLVGDKVLQHLSSLIVKQIRKDDIFARWGGEEFIFVLDTSKQAVVKIVENIRLLIEKEPFEEIGSVTCSFGITEFLEGDTIESMTNRADEALYEAKESGRNRVCVR